MFLRSFSFFYRISAEITMQLDCLQIAKAAGLGQGKTSGKEILFHCSRHPDKHPSLSIHPGKNKWFCGPCGKGGGAADESGRTSITLAILERGNVRTVEVEAPVLFSHQKIVNLTNAGIQLNSLQARDCVRYVTALQQANRIPTSFDNQVVWTKTSARTKRVRVPTGPHSHWPP